MKPCPCNNIYCQDIGDGILYGVISRKPDVFKGTYNNMVGSVMLSLSDKEMEEVAIWSKEANRTAMVDKVRLGITNIEIDALVIR